MRQHTEGPWRWTGNGKSDLRLSTVGKGQRLVMDFVRKGMRGAQPRFQPKIGQMINAWNLLEFQVGDPTVRGMEEAKVNNTVYRYDITGIDAPDSRLIQSSPELYDLLEEAVGKLSEVEGAVDLIDRAVSLMRRIDGES